MCAYPVPRQLSYYYNAPQEIAAGALLPVTLVGLVGLGYVFVLYINYYFESIIIIMNTGGSRFVVGRNRRVLLFLNPYFFTV